jgi:hypothetical protein
MRTHSKHRSRAGLLIFGLAASATIVACGSDEDGAATTPVSGSETPSTEVPSTEDMGSNVESLSYLIQGLMTTDQIGGGWIDQGRRIVPPGSDQLTGFLCEEGETTVAALGGRLDPQVSTSYERPDDVGLDVSESLMWGDRDQVTADFESLVEAVTACAGTTYATTELGELTLALDEPPDLGTSAVAFRFGPATPPSDTPWIESQLTTVLLSDPDEPVALVVSAVATKIHNPPDLDVTELDPAEYERIVETAVNRIVEEGL